MSISEKVDIKKLIALAMKADQGQWQLNQEEDLVLLENNNSVTAKTDRNFANNMAYIASISPEVIISVLNQVLESKINKSLKAFATKALELASRASRGPWVYDFDKKAVLMSNGIEVLSWIDFEDRTNAEYIALCCPRNLIPVLTAIQL